MGCPIQKGSREGWEIGIRGMDEDGEAEGGYRENLECFEEGFLKNSWKVEKRSKDSEDLE